MSLLLPRGADRDRIIEEMRKDGVDSRPVFHCSHHMPMYASTAPSNGGDLRVAEDIAARGLSVPSFPAMTDEMIDRVCEALANALGHST